MAATTRSLPFIYDVFLSFRGEDTRYGFTGNLYRALCEKGIHTFFDEEKLHGGDEITPALSKAIQESRIAITVLSQNYAFSSFCLDELVTILHCKSEGLLVIPVFYNVDPSDLRHQKGSYGEAMTKHQKRFESKMEKLQKWRMALKQVADLSGHHFKDGDAYEYKFIGSIVEEVSRKINRASLHVPDYPVGLESQVTDLMKLLDVGSDDVVHIIGIHGMRGLGKTTLALAVYNLIALHFDESCFLQNVREESNKHGLKHLQSILLLKLLGEKDINLTSWQEGASMIQHRLRRKKVLLILDDADRHEQLKAIVGRPDWFGPGSRVIITTRDKHLLKYHGIERTYEVKVLNHNAALQLLTWNAFRREKIDPSYEHVLNRVVAYASGLPLALEVIGSHLFEKTVAEWEYAVEHYSRIPIDEIVDILKVSFDATKQETQGYKFTVINNALTTPGGVRFRDKIGAEYANRTLELATQFVWRIFQQKNPSDRKNVQKVSLVVDDMEGIAYTMNNEIHVSARYVNGYSGGDVKREITGVLFHQVCYVWQWYGNGEAPGGLIGGIADFVRLKANYAASHWRKPGQGQRWDEGYDITAHFLDYCDSLKSGFVAQLNQLMRTGYSDQFFVQLLGKPVDQLWRDYKAQYGNLA
ncbi:TMV resistance protein N-like [Glycine soja]|uniref:TMV resistance protein N n=1 Tax=Glycine soja TaxID=3848 RepID=A0A445GLE4_GLYSO|nr:TMV resistance protein N-like [Glycine soja]RZB62058.1 TMV resistance protein N [Glycine soja]